MIDGRAYFYACKMNMKLVTGVDLAKLYFVVANGAKNKLAFIPGLYFQASIVFTSKAGAHPQWSTF